MPLATSPSLCILPDIFYCRTKWGHGDRMQEAWKQQETRFQRSQKASEVILHSSWRSSLGTPLQILKMLILKQSLIGRWSFKNVRFFMLSNFRLFATCRRLFVQILLHLSLDPNLQIWKVFFVKFPIRSWFFATNSD